MSISLLSRNTSITLSSALRISEGWHPKCKTMTWREEENLSPLFEFISGLTEKMRKLNCCIRRCLNSPCKMLLVIFAVLALNVFQPSTRLLGEMPDTGSVEVGEKKCFLVSSRLQGNHSYQRMLQATSWFQTATLQSSIKAAHHYQRRLNSRDYFYFRLEVTEGYRKLINENSTKMFRNIVPFHFYLTSQRTSNGSFLSPECGTVYLTRLDADDLLDIYFFERLQKETLRRMNEVLVLGAWEIESLMIDKSSNGTILCKTTHLKKWRGYQYSLGQTVVISYWNWLKYFHPNTVLGDHTKLASIVRSKSPSLTIKEQELNRTGIYTITQLSGHFIDDVSPICDFHLMIQAVGPENAAIVVNSLNSLPDLTKSERQENSFWDNASGDRLKGVGK